MSVKIEDDRNNLDNIILGLATIKSKSVNVGILDDESEQMKIIAGANEFGAEIKSKKAIRYFWMLMSKFKKSTGVIDKSDKYKTGGKSGGQSIIIPERSYLRSTADDSEVQNKIVETIRFYLYQALTGKNTFGEVLTRAGNVLQRAIQSRIMTDIEPANHPLTVRLKGQDKTLIGRTRKLISAIKSRVV